jgi:hypothetical protein
MSVFVEKQLKDFSEPLLYRRTDFEANSLFTVKCLLCDNWLMCDVTFVCVAPMIKLSSYHQQ